MTGDAAGADDYRSLRSLNKSAVMSSETLIRGDFTYNLYRRVQLAAAVSVIRRTPKGISPETYATDLQRKLKLLWLNSPITGGSQLNVFVDRHILSRMQDLLAFRLRSIISESSYHDITVCSQTENVNYPVQQTDEVLFNNLNANRAKIQASANFIQAVIHLKALAEAQTSIPFDTYVTSVSSMCNRMTKFHFPYNSEGRLARPTPSVDSGFCTTDDNNDVNKSTEAVKGVASSVILYIVNSCNANELLQKSIESIIVQLRDIALEDDGIYLQDTIDQWKGSVYHHAMLAFHSIFSVQLVNVHRTVPCQQLCLLILQDMFEHVSQKNYLTKNDYYLKENQTAMLFELSHATNLWIQTLDGVFKKIEDLAHLIHLSDTSFEQPTELSLHQDNELVFKMQNYLQELELGFFVFKSVKPFLQNINRYIVKKEGKQQHSHVEHAQNKTQRTIGDLWRKHYIGEANCLTVSRVTDEDSEAKFKVNKWRHLLSDSFKNSLFNNSLIAITICECIPLLTDLDL